MSILDEKNWEWVSKNKFTFLLIVLIAANAYQYLAREKYEKNSEQIMTEALNYERGMSGKLENLLEELVRLNAEKK
jgi:hypothetical protein